MLNMASSNKQELDKTKQRIPAVEIWQSQSQSERIIYIHRHYLSLNLTLPTLFTREIVRNRQNKTQKL